MDLVRRHRRPIRIALRTLAHPLVVGPGVGGRGPDARRRLGPDLHAEGEGIGLQAQRAVTAEDLVLVELSDTDARDEDLPHPGGAHAAQWQQPAVPSVEVTDDPNASRVRRPDREADAGDALVRPRMRAEDVIQALVRAL